MEEHHARDLAGHYNSLVVHKHHNYYFGRAEADLTSWIEYFVTLLARVFIQAKDEAVNLSQTGIPLEHKKLRKLDRRARVVLSLFSKKDSITTNDAAKALGLSSRMMRILMKQWVEDGWLYSLEDNPSGRKAFKQGQWNTFRIEVTGDTIKTWINGVLSASVYDISSRGWYSVGRQSYCSVKDDLYEDPNEVRFTGQACPWTRAF